MAKTKKKAPATKRTRSRSATPKRSSAPSRASAKGKKVKVPRSMRQSSLPEMEQPANARIENAARDYADARDERMRLGEEEQRRHTKLLAVMEAEGVKVYKHRTGGEVIEVKIAAKDATAKAKVRIYDADEPPANAAPAVGGEGEPAVEGDEAHEETIGDA